MSKAQYAILRFAKYKGPTVSRIEAHNERAKETYASNPDIKTELSRHNFHPVSPKGKYKDVCNEIIRRAGCKTRKDSVTAVEVLVTASPEFFEKRNRKEVKEFFEYAVEFLKTKQDPETYISAVVHVDEKTPHMHLCFVPITSDGRLSAKEIIGNKKRLTKQKAHLDKLISEINPLNGKAKAAEIAVILDKYIPAVEAMYSNLNKYNVAFRETTTQNKQLKKKNAELKESLESALKTSTLKKLEEVKLRRDYEDAAALLEKIPKEVLEYYEKEHRMNQIGKER